MVIEVREVRPDEYAEAGEVTARAYEEFSRPDEDWDDYLAQLRDVKGREAKAKVLVAVEDGAVVGTVTLELDLRIDGDRDGETLAPGQAHVRMLAVHPPFRRRGAARALMDACIAVGREEGKTVLTLNTTPRMEAARSLYESLGFRRGEDRVFEDGFRLLSYSIDL